MENNVILKQGCHSQASVLGIFRIRNARGVKQAKGYEEDPRQQPSGMTAYLKMTRGFTLIEILVVVLIIAVLAAVALPQYQKAVWRSRAAQLKLYVRQIAAAEHAYYLEHGQYAVNFKDMDVKLPLTALKTRSGSAYGVCHVGVRGTDSVREGDGFYIVLNSTTNANAVHIVSYFTSGPYKCAGFRVNISDGPKLWCAEKINYMTPAGAFCEKLERATFVNGGSASMRYYNLP